MADTTVLHNSVSGDIHADRDLFERIERANHILEEKVRSSVLNQELAAAGTSIQGDWHPVQDNAGRPLWELTLSFSDGGRSSARFSREELKNESRLRSKLDWLWGDVLQLYSHRQLQQLLRTGDIREGT